MISTEKAHLKYRHAYAVLRVDGPLNLDTAGNRLAVPKVFGSKVAAEQEASRLSEVNRGKGCVYISCLLHRVQSSWASVRVNLIHHHVDDHARHAHIEPQRQRPPRNHSMLVEPL